MVDILCRHCRDTYRVQPHPPQGGGMLKICILHSHVEPPYCGGAIFLSMTSHCKFPLTSLLSFLPKTCDSSVTAVVTIVISIFAYKSSSDPRDSVSDDHHTRYVAQYSPQITCVTAVKTFLSFPPKYYHV